MLIKIDRSSLRVNPNAGRTEFRFIIAKTITEEIIECDLDDPQVLMRKTYVNNKLVEETPFISENPIDLNETYMKTLAIEYETETVYSIIPEGDWLYEYENTIVMCHFCGNTFYHTELKDEDSYEMRICPRCGQWECCDPLEYEKLTPDMIKE
jgi:hypothetical protein